MRAQQGTKALRERLQHWMDGEDVEDGITDEEREVRRGAVYRILEVLSSDSINFDLSDLTLTTLPEAEIKEINAIIAIRQYNHRQRNQLDNRPRAAIFNTLRSNRNYPSLPATNTNQPNLRSTLNEIIRQSAGDPSEITQNDHDLIQFILNSKELEGFRNFIEQCKRTSSWRDGGQKRKDFCRALHNVMLVLKEQSRNDKFIERVNLISIGSGDSCGDRVAITFAKIQMAIKFPDLPEEMERKGDAKGILEYARQSAVIKFLDDKASTVRTADEIDTKLAYMQIAKDLGVDLAAIDMLYRPLSNVSDKDLEDAKIEYNSPSVIEGMIQGEYLTYQYMLDAEEFENLNFAKEAKEEKIKEDSAKEGVDDTLMKEGESTETFKSRMARAKTDSDEALFKKLNDKLRDMTITTSELREERRRGAAAVEEEAPSPNPKLPTQAGKKPSNWNQR